jgi:hypothetical protein
LVVVEEEDGDADVATQTEAAGEETLLVGGKRVLRWQVGRTG